MLKECPECGKDVPYAAWKCEHCGADLPRGLEAKGASPTADPATLETNRKSGALAAGLNIIFPGAGYMYCGRVFLGIIAFFFVALMVLTFPFVAIPLWGVLVIDGFLAANRYNSKLDEKISAAMKTCPRCAEKVQPAAQVCKHCGHEFATEAAG